MTDLLLPDGVGATALVLAGRVASAPAGLPLVIAALAAWLLLARARRPWRLLIGDAKGSAAIDLVMVVPIFTYVMLLFLQFAILLQDAQILHYAAFVAARSARVHLCAPLPAGTVEGIVQSVLRRRPCDNDPRRAELAARFALIAASPAEPSYVCRGACAPPTDALAALAGGMGMRGNLDAWQAEARYAYDADNVSVTVGPAGLAILLSLPGKSGNREMPVNAIVTFRHALLPLMSPVYGRGNPFATMTAEVTLL